MILSERGYVVKERGIINVKGKGNMRTYFILGRKISRRHGRGSGTTNNNLTEVVYGMARAKRRRTFRRERGCDISYENNSQNVLKSGDTQNLLGRNNPIKRSFRRLNNLRCPKTPIEEISESDHKVKEMDSKVTFDGISLEVIA